MSETIPPVPETEKPKAETPVKPLTETPKKKISTKTILIIVAVAVAILVPVVLYFVMDYKIDRLKEDQQKEIAAVKQQASDLVKKNNEVNLQHVAKVFAWAVRGEAMRNNLDPVNQMMIELVKIDAYRQVVLLADDGTVVLSTDKKYEGEGLNELFYKQILGSNDIMVYPQKNGDLFVSAPIMGIDSRLGTLVIAYKPIALEFPALPAAE